MNITNLKGENRQEDWEESEEGEEGNAEEVEEIEEEEEDAKYYYPEFEPEGTLNVISILIQTF